MQIEIIDYEPIYKTIEEVSEESTRSVFMAKRRAVNVNIKLIVEELVKLLDDIYSDYICKDIDSSDEEYDEINYHQASKSKKIKIFELTSIDVKRRGDSENPLNYEEKEDVWGTIVLFLSGICTEPDSSDFPALPAIAPEVNSKFKKIIFDFQKSFIVRKAKNTTKPTKITRPVKVRYNNKEIKISGCWTETVLCKSIRKKLPPVRAQMSEILASVKDQIKITKDDKSTMIVDVLNSNDVVPFAGKIFKRQQYYFKIDEIYNASNDSSYFELKGMSEIPDE